MSFYDYTAVPPPPNNTSSTHFGTRGSRMATIMRLIEYEKQEDTGVEHQVVIIQFCDGPVRLFPFPWFFPLQIILQKSLMLHKYDMYVNHRNFIRERRSRIAGGDHDNAHESFEHNIDEQGWYMPQANLQHPAEQFEIVVSDEDEGFSEEDEIVFELRREHNEAAENLDVNCNLASIRDPREDFGGYGESHWIRSIFKEIIRPKDDPAIYGYPYVKRKHCWHHNCAHNS